MEDRDIVALYWARQEAAIEQTAKKYGSYLTAIAMRILSDARDTEECLNDTYQAAWDSIPPHAPENLGTYLAKLARRICMKVWRGRDAQKRGGGDVTLSLEELGQCIPSGHTPEEQVTAEELACSINAFLLALPETERRVFVRRYFYVDPIGDICRRFGFSKSKVETMLHRTRKKLKVHLQKEGYCHE